MSLREQFLNLFDENFIELVHMILSKLDNGAHVLFVFQPEGLIDPNEDHASSLTIIHDRSFRSGRKQIRQSMRRNWTYIENDIPYTYSRISRKILDRFWAIFFQFALYAG